MKKYLINRILRGLVSIFLVVAIVMIMIYSLLNRDLIFASDPQFTKFSNNQQVLYKYHQWQNYGYLDCLEYSDYLKTLVKNGELDEETRRAAVNIGRKAENDSDTVAQYVAKFEEYCKANGFTVLRLPAITRSSKSKQLADGGKQMLFAYRDRSLLQRLWDYFSGLIQVDNIHRVEDENFTAERKLSFTLRDPLYGGEKISPAIIGSGTLHKYLIYCDSKFPYIHQNLLTISLGKSYSVNKDEDVFITMTRTQGDYVTSLVTFPTGLEEMSADDLHTAVYQPGSQGTDVNKPRFVDNYTNVQLTRSGMSKMGYSFVIGIIATCLAYLIAIPMGIWVALKKDKLVDKLGTFYIVFIMAVPSVAYILMFKAAGNATGLPTTFVMRQSHKVSMYVLPIISLALPQIAGLMRWLRRFMIDQMNSDYVKFARSGGLSEREIFSKHILKNAIIPIVHGIPGSILGAMVGAFITERVYTVPGMGGLLIDAIGAYDNGVIVGVTLFYATISVIALIMGDLLMSMVDPRINFTAKAR